MASRGSNKGGQLVIITKTKTKVTKHKKVPSKGAPTSKKVNLDDEDFEYRTQSIPYGGGGGLNAIPYHSSSKSVTKEGSKKRKSMKESKESKESEDSKKSTSEKRKSAHEKKKGSEEPTSKLKKSTGKKSSDKSKEPRKSSEKSRSTDIKQQVKPKKSDSKESNKEKPKSKKSKRKAKSTDLLGKATKLSHQASESKFSTISGLPSQPSGTSHTRRFSTESRTLEEVSVTPTLTDSDGDIPAAFQTRKKTVEKKREPWELAPEETVEVLQKIGQGGMGKVFKGRWRSTIVAVKTCSTTNPSDLDRFRREIQLMSELRHPNIVLFMRANLEPKNTFFLTEYVALGNLHEVVNTQKPDFNVKLKFAQGIAMGMTYLHENTPTIIHRDLKSLNVLVDENYVCKVADFGISKTTTGNKATMTNAGSLNWSAPELLEDEKATKECDVYSFGCVLWEILTGEFPFVTLSTFGILKALKGGERPIIPQDTDTDFADLIQICWNQDPAKRPYFGTIVDMVEKIQSRYSQDGGKRASMVSKKIKERTSSTVKTGVATSNRVSTRNK